MLIALGCRDLNPAHAVEQYRRALADGTSNLARQSVEMQVRISVGSGAGVDIFDVLAAPPPPVVGV